MATEKQESQRWTGRARRPGTLPWGKTNGMVQVRKSAYHPSTVDSVIVPSAKLV